MITVSKKGIPAYSQTGNESLQNLKLPPNRRKHLHIKGNRSTPLVIFIYRPSPAKRKKSYRLTDLISELSPGLSAGPGLDQSSEDQNWASFPMLKIQLARHQITQ